MTRINLLPWREERREKRKRKFISLWGSVGVWTLLFVLVVHLLVGSWVDSQQERNRILNQEIADLDKKIEDIKNLKKVRADLVARMHVIQDLQTNRPLIVKMYSQLVKLMPKGIYYQQVSREANVLNVVGFAESNTNISDFMRSLESSELFELPRLSEIKETTVGKKSLSQFNLVFQLKDFGSPASPGAKPVTQTVEGQKRA